MVKTRTPRTKTLADLVDKPLLATDVEWDQASAADYVFQEIAPCLRGDPWQGSV
jgi:hypothetical protein